MIDVSILSGACPRCFGRRVYSVNIPEDRWACVPNAMPVPWLHEQVRHHSATNLDEMDLELTPGLSGQVHE